MFRSPKGRDHGGLWGVAVGSSKGALRVYRDHLGEPLTSQGTLLAPEDLIKILQAVPGAQEGVNTFEDHLQRPKQAWGREPIAELSAPPSSPPFLGLLALPL